jgi:Flp pilus assembly protein TadD
MRTVLGLIVAATFITCGAYANADMNKTVPALSPPAGSPADAHNKEGIAHYNQGHWDAALTHFTEAAKVDPQAAEVHYNVALALDKLGKHKEATEHFHAAHEFGKGNASIQESDILKGHLHPAK